MDKIKIALVDDSPFVRDGLKIIFDLDEDFDVVGCGQNGNEAVEISKMEKVDVFLMDIQMPVMDGIDATKAITESSDAKVLILTTFDDDELIVKALKNGAKGYILKNHPPEKIKQMVKLIHEGRSILDEGMLGKLTDLGGSRDKKVEFDTEFFTDRENEIIRLVSEGLSNGEIAESLFISLGTVKNYISSILDKTGLSHRTQIAVFYLTGRKPHSNS